MNLRSPYLRGRKLLFSVHRRFPSQTFMYQAVPLYWLTVILSFYTEFASENGNIGLYISVHKFVVAVHALSPCGIKKICRQFTNRQVSVILLLHLRKINKVAEIIFLCNVFFELPLSVNSRNEEILESSRAKHDFCRQTPKCVSCGYAFFAEFIFFSKSWFLLKENYFFVTRLLFDRPLSTLARFPYNSRIILLNKWTHSAIEPLVYFCIIAASKFRE